MPKQKLTLSNVATFSHSVAASKEALKQLKELLERGPSMKDEKEIRDDEIRIIGDNASSMGT